MGNVVEIEKLIVYPVSGSVVVGKLTVFVDPTESVTVVGVIAVENTGAVLITVTVIGKSTVAYPSLSVSVTVFVPI